MFVRLTHAHRPPLPEAGFFENGLFLVEGRCLGELSLGGVFFFEALFRADRLCFAVIYQRPFEPFPSVLTAQRSIINNNRVVA